MARDAKELIEKAKRNRSKSLDLSNCGLTTVPDEIWELTYITKLSLSRNQLTSVPNCIGNLTSLNTLYLYANQFTCVPDSIVNLTSLKGLYLFDNQLTCVPDCIGNLTSLDRLYLSSNRLTSVPNSIGNLTRLKRLDLSRNQLMSVPDSIGNLISLDKLNLSRNQLTSVPDSIGNLTRLKRLDLSCNQLIGIPESIDNLINLTELDTSGNHLTSVPECIGNLGNLVGLNLYGNDRLISPPLDVVNLGLDAIRAYFKELSQSTPQWVSKLLIVGEGGVGKTNVLNILSGMDFDHNLSTTHGIELRNIIFPHPEQTDVEMQLNAWDFGGQEIYHATHQFFLTNRSLFLLLWNARLGYEQGKLYYWLDAIKSRAPESPVIIVATHIDERDADLPWADIQRNYPKVIGPCAISNKTGMGMPELIQMIQQIAADLPLMGEKWPTSWLNAANAIRGLNDRCKTPNELRSLCRRHGVKEEGVEVLLRWMHELGDILYFHDNEELKDTIVLKPQWVTQYISKVLESKEVIESNGVFKRQHMDVLWSDLDSNTREYFLCMMEQFDLSYRTLLDKDKSLVVERLSLDEPFYQAKWDEPLKLESFKQIHMRYEMNTVPAGIPTWFIARSHRFTTDTDWRLGALFAQDDTHRNIALVTCSQQNRILDLKVRGSNPNYFFNQLRDGVEVTLSRFPGLTIKRKMPCPGHHGKQCDYWFDWDNLNRAVEIGRESVECQKAYEQVPLIELLFGIHPSTQPAVLQRLDEISGKLDVVTANQSKELDELKELRAITQQGFYDLFERTREDIETGCPRIFILSKQGATPASDEYLLELLCEMPGGAHPIGAQYPIKAPKEWFKKAAPLFIKMIKVLKYATPIIGAGLPIEAPNQKDLENDIKFMESLIKPFDDFKEMKPSYRPDDSDIGGYPTVSGAELRSLYRMLDEKDPSHFWGGLRRVLTKENHYLWLCGECAEKFNKPVTRLEANTNTTT